jgi:hypothetical protein
MNDTVATALDNPQAATDQNRHNDWDHGSRTSSGPAANAAQQVVHMTEADQIEHSVKKRLANGGRPHMAAPSVNVRANTRHDSN